MAADNFTDIALQEVFSICPTSDVTSTTLAACTALEGTSFLGTFAEYFDDAHKPQLPSSLYGAPSCVAIVDCDRDAELAIETMQRLRTMPFKALSIVAFATQAESAFLVRAMRAGCNEFFHKPTETIQLQEALQRFQKGRQVSHLSSDSAGKVLSFLGVKGGVGTTTLAVHVAYSLARHHRKSVLLVDHHHELGHVALHLGLKGSLYHFGDLLRSVDRLDVDLLKGFVVSHASGLQVLGSPDACASNQEANPEHIKQVFAFLRTQYDFVIVDSSLGSSETMSAICQASDDVYLVASPDIAALRDLSRRVEHLSLIGDTTGKFRLVINRSTAQDAVSPEQIRQSIHHPVWITVPNNYVDLIHALNAGNPSSAHNRSAYAKQITAWTHKLVDTSPAPSQQQKTSGKRLSWWAPKQAKIA